MNRKKQVLTLVILTLILVLSATVAINLGSVDIDVKTTSKMLINSLLNRDIFNPSWEKTTEFIVLKLRLPRILLACIVGGGLSMTGVLIQALTQNPLADPYLLGVSSGASLGAVLAISSSFFNVFGTSSTAAGGFIGAVLAACLVFKISNIGGSYTTSKLILIGVAVSAVFSSITTMILFFLSGEGQLRQAVFWMSGSLSGAGIENLAIPFYIWILVFIVGIVISPELDAMILGDEHAITLGVNTQMTRNIIVLCATLLTGVLVSVSGVIGFIGLIIPHISRHFAGVKHRFLIPVSIFLGAIFLIWADAISRIVFSEAELPIGVVTSFCGAIFFIWLMKNSLYRFGGKK